MIKNLESIDEVRQLLESELAAILFYTEGGPIPELFSEVGEQFSEITLGQIDADKHPHLVEEARSGIHAPQPPCVFTFRDGSFLEQSQIDPKTGAGIKEILAAAAAEL